MVGVHVIDKYLHEYNKRKKRVCMSYNVHRYIITPQDAT